MTKLQKRTFVILTNPRNPLQSSSVNEAEDTRPALPDDEPISKWMLMSN